MLAVNTEFGEDEEVAVGLMRDAGARMIERADGAWRDGQLGRFRSREAAAGGRAESGLTSRPRSGSTGNNPAIPRHKETRMNRSISRLRMLRGRLPALRARQEGRWGYILAWLSACPIPILILIYLLRGCT